MTEYVRKDPSRVNWKEEYLRQVQINKEQAEAFMKAMSKRQEAQSKEQMDA